MEGFISGITGVRKNGSFGALRLLRMTGRGTDSSTPLRSAQNDRAGEFRVKDAVSYCVYCQEGKYGFFCNDIRVGFRSCECDF